MLSRWMLLSISRFYEHMHEGLFIGMANTTPNDFKISVKVPEIITHEKRLDINSKYGTLFE